ncbi:MAG: hypothetical protein LBH57_07175 [Treponema sp.]|nr:hypothetical protein [Treponema sp.]
MIIVSAFFAAGCGELDSVLSSSLSSNSVYRVNAAVEGRNLDECAIMGIDSRIRPYFLNSVEGDPDITGLVVFLETPEGEQASRKVRYVIGTEDQISGQVADTGNNAGSSRIPESAAPEPPQIPEGQTESGEDGYGKDEIPQDEERPYESYDSYETHSPYDSYEDPAPEEGENAGAEQDPFSGDDWGDGPVYQIRERRSLFDTPGESGDSDELVVYVPRFDGELPALLFPEKLAIGPYILVFRILGLQGVLGYSEKFIYYVSDADLSLGDIQTYHSGSVERSGVVDPGSIIMLEAKVSADDRLEPYIIWYNGRKQIREGPVSKGIDRLLWQAPVQTGFQSLRAEIFPFKPPAAFRNANGLVKELPLVISSKQAKRAAGDTGAFQQESALRWYQLSGDFSDSLAPGDAERKLTPGNNTAITWLPKAGIYGLAAGPAHAYTIPGNLFTPDENLPGRGQFVFRFALQSSGIVSSVLFALDRTSQTLKLDLFGDTQTGQLILSYALGDDRREQRLPLPLFAWEGWITAVVDFSAGDGEFLADLGLLSAENGEFTAELASLPDKSAPEGKGIALPGALTGEGVLRIGAAASPANSSASGRSGFGAAREPPFAVAESYAIPGEENPGAAVSASTAAAENPVPLNTGAADDADGSEPVLIVDEIVVLFSAVEAREEAPAESEDETGEAEAEEAEAGEETEAKTAPEAGAVSGDAGPRKSAPPEQPGPAPASEDRNAPASGKGPEPEPHTELATAAEPETDGKDSGDAADEETGPPAAGEEPDSAEKTEDGGHTPDSPDAEMQDPPAPESD